MIVNWRWEIRMMTAPGSEVQRNESVTVSKRVQTYHVYLCNGDIRTVSPGTELTCGQRDVVIFDGECVVASFHRREVYFASRERISPPILF
jgi:hypothetical protein